MAGVTIHTDMYFLKKDNLHTIEKPYAFRYPIEDDDSIPQTNMKMGQRSLTVTDMRGTEDKFKIDTDGFEILRHESALDYEGFYDTERVTIYLRELEVLLKRHLKATYVEVFRHGVSYLHHICS